MVVREAPAVVRATRSLHRAGDGGARDVGGGACGRGVRLARRVDAAIDRNGHELRRIVLRVGDRLAGRRQLAASSAAAWSSGVQPCILYCASLSITCQHGTVWLFSTQDGTLGRRHRAVGVRRDVLDDAVGSAVVAVGDRRVEAAGADRRHDELAERSDRRRCSRCRRSRSGGCALPRRRHCSDAHRRVAEELGVGGATGTSG